MGKKRAFKKLRITVGISLSIAIAVALGLACSPGVRELDARDLSDSLVRQAVSARSQGDIETAVRLYRKALDQDPLLARAHLDLAVMLQDRLKQYVNAVYHYRRYLELRPETEKRTMIKDRIRIASEDFAAAVRGPGGSGSAELEEENAALRKKVAMLEAQVLRLRRQIKNEEQKASREDSEFIMHQVKRGETLTGIAEKYYGDPDGWARIYEANKGAMRNSRDLQPGQAIRIPVR
ncbi:MAG: LysM peptidoglycan-binding domain-containing protein [Kiritimatiellia bacterium]